MHGARKRRELNRVSVKYLALVLRNLPRNRRRTSLTIFSIGVSIFIFAVLISLPAVVNQILHDSASDVRVLTRNKAGIFYTLPAAYEPIISAMPHVMAVSGVLIWFGSYRNSTDTIAGVAIDPDPVREIWPDWRISAREAEQLRGERSAGIVAPGVMKRFGWKVGDTITLDGSPAPIELKIIGSYVPNDPTGAILMRRDMLDETSPTHGKAIFFWIKVDRSDSIPAVISEIDHRFANSEFQTESQSEFKFAQDTIRPYRLLFDGAKFLAGLVIVVIGMVAANTAAMAVRERRREFAVMRALGYTRRMITLLALGEGFVIGCAGGALGCALAFVALRLMPYAGAALGPFAQILQLLPVVEVESFAVAAAIGVASAAIPVLSTVRRPIASELRAL